MTDPNCTRCQGTGSYETEGDAHKSAGIVPCYCEDPLPVGHWLRILVDSSSTGFVTGVSRRGQIRKSQERAREVLRLVKSCQGGNASPGRLQRLAQLIISGE